MDTDIRPLIDNLSFIADKKSWGYTFRYGHLQINIDDFLLITSNILDENTFKQLKKEIEHEK